MGRGRWGYYLATVAAGRESPGGLVEPDGAWLGRVASSLALEGLAVDGLRLGALLDGVDPATGEVLDPAHHRVRVAAFDCTFAAPKSVSLVHALASPDVVAEVRAAHEASVAAVLGYLEDEAARVRHRSGGEDRVVPATGLCAATFLHRASRAPDPHLHSHVLVANLGRDGSGRWSALDGRPLFLYAATAGALYRAQLRDELVRRLDVSWRWREDGFADLAGVRPEALRAFSRRREAIVAGLVAEGRSGPRAARIAATRDRPGKDLATAYESLVESWRERAYAVGVSAGRVAALTPARPPGRDRPPPGPATTRRDAPDVRSGPFTRRGLVLARSQAFRDGGRVAEVVASVDAELAAGLGDGSIVADPDRALATARLHGRAGVRIPSGAPETVLVTREFLALEARLSRDLGDAREPGAGPLPPGLFSVRATAGEPFVLAARLAQAVRQALADGRPVLAMAPGARRAAHLEAVTGIPAVSHHHRSPPERHALVLAGDADHWDLAALAALVESGAAMASTVLVAPSPAGTGRRALARALSREPAPRCRRDAVAPSPAGRGERLSAGPVAVRLVPTATVLVGALLEEHARQREEIGESVVVVADRALARAVERASNERARVTAAADVGAALRAAPGAGVVVLGGARLAGRALGRRPDLARVHVAVEPPVARAHDRARWGVYLATGHPGVDAGLARGRGRQEAGRDVAGRGLGLETGLGSR